MKISCEDIRDSSGDAAVRGRIFRVAGSSAERQPGWITGECGIVSSGLDCGDRPPETEGELRVPASYGRIRVSGPEHRHQTGRVGGAEPFLRDQIAERTRVLGT